MYIQCCLQVIKRNLYPYVVFVLCLILLSCQSFPNVSSGRWIQIHQQSKQDTVNFVRQYHGGSAFDAKRGRLILFGSDTHGENWYNSPFFFDTHKLQWYRLYPDDPVNTYKVNVEGIPVAGKEGVHPWAMHTFAAISYDSIRDQLVVSSYPKHMVPSRFSSALIRQWPLIKRHPTWILDLASESWSYLPDKAVHFFPFTTSYDSNKQRILGYRHDGVFALENRPRRWKKLAEPGFLGYHNNSVYDSKQNAFVVMGSHENSNDVVVYWLADGKHVKMPTRGMRPPKAQFIPMAYHEKLGKIVALFEARKDKEKRITKTWIYDLSMDSWSFLDTAILPFPLKMNYNLEYDSVHNVLLLVTGQTGSPTTVWVLKL